MTYQHPRMGQLPTCPPAARHDRLGQALTAVFVAIVIMMAGLLVGGWFVRTTAAWVDCGAPTAAAMQLAVTRGAPSALQCVSAAVTYG